jgi:hypothetical protein
MRDDLDAPFGRRFYDRADQRENRDAVTERFARCTTLREMGRACLHEFHVPGEIVSRILNADATRGVRAMNLAREARRGRARTTSRGRVQREVRPKRTKPRPWEV